jgi:hypothetical protein
MMHGWKTWAAALAMAILGVVDIFSDQPETGIEKIVAAMALIGIGHKIEKNTK